MSGRRPDSIRRLQAAGSRTVRPLGLPPAARAVPWCRRSGNAATRSAIRRIVVRRARRATVPTPFLQVEPTTRCNYTCTFCAGRSLAQIDRCLGTFRSVVDAASGLEHVELQGEGEPFLHPHFFDMVELIRERYPRSLISTTTNGSLLIEEVIAGLIHHRVNKVVVSVQSADEGEYASLRGGELSRVREGIAALQHAKLSGASGVPEVGLAVTVLKSTAGRIGAIGRFCWDLELDGGYNLQLLNRMKYYVRAYDDRMRLEFLGDEDTQRFVREDASAPHARWFLEQSGRLPIFSRRLYGRSAGGAGCPWLDHGLLPTANGTACACCFIKDPGDSFGPFDVEERGLYSQETRSHAACPSVRYDAHHVPRLLHG